MEGRKRILTEVRSVYKKIIARLIIDKDEIPDLNYLELTNIPFNEVPGNFADGTAGIYFTFSVDFPVNMEEDGSDWI